MELMGDSISLKLIRVWWKVTLLAVQTQLINVWSLVIFIAGKVIRFLLYFAFLFGVLSSLGKLGKYGLNEMIIFLLVFNLIDIFTQALFRGVYHFRNLVVSGDYDLDLLKPIPSFFRPIFGMPDIFDFITFIPLLIFFIVFALGHFSMFTSQILLFLILFLNSMLIAFAFHLFVCAVCVMTTEIDHLVWVYRDLTNMARFSTDIYPKVFQLFLTIPIPVVILMTVPAKAFLGLLSWSWVVLSLAIGILSVLASLKFWHYALKQYCSASS